jgi:signal transduction histidine kinase
VDALVAGIVGIVIFASMTVAAEPSSRRVDLLAYLLGLAAGLLLLVRRRWPVPVLAASALLIVTYHVLDYPAIGLAFPLVAALYSAAVSGRVAATAGLCAALLAATAVWRAGIEHTPGLVVATNTLQEGLLMAAVVLLGDALHSRRALAGSMLEVLRAAEAEREQEMHRRMAEERLRIARELHDVTAHTVTVIGVQAEVAAEVLDDDVEVARGAIDAVCAAGHDAVLQLQATLDLLREGDGGAPRVPAPRLAQLDELLDTMRTSGLEVETAVTGHRRPLPAAVDLTAYRLLQESLTNVLRHAGEPRADVIVHYARDALHITVCSHGAAPPATGRAGHGIAGMAERVHALGGALDAGPQPDGGFRVTARIPAAERA